VHIDFDIVVHHQNDAVLHVVFKSVGFHLQAVWADRKIGEYVLAAGIGKNGVRLILVGLGHDELRVRESGTARIGNRAGKPAPQRRFEPPDGFRKEKKELKHKLPLEGSRRRFES
jgi:hypothetical protein